MGMLRLSGSGRASGEGEQHLSEGGGVVAGRDVHLVVETDRDAVRVDVHGAQPWAGGQELRELLRVERSVAVHELPPLRGRVGARGPRLQAQPMPTARELGS